MIQLKNLDFTSTPVLAVCGLVALITVIAYWRVFKKIGISGFNAIVPIWSEVRLANESTGFWISFLIAILYIVSGGLVAFAYIRSMTQPSTENRMLLLASIGIGTVLLLLEGISHYQLGKKFNKSFLFRFLMFIPCITTLMIWVLAFTKSNYTECVETFGLSKQEIYPLSGIDGQAEYNPSPIEYTAVDNYEEYDYKSVEPIEPIEPVLPDTPMGLEPSDFIEPVAPVAPEIQENKEITLDDISSGAVGYDDLTLENRPLYPFETKKPERIEADKTEMQKALEEALFDEDNEELQEAVLQFIDNWNKPTIASAQEVEQVKEPVIKEDIEDIDALLEKAKKKSKPRKVNFDDDFWK